MSKASRSTPTRTSPSPARRAAPLAFCACSASAGSAPTSPAPASSPPRCVPASSPRASSCTATARPTPTSTPRWPPAAACWCWTAPDEGARVAAAAARARPAPGRGGAGHAGHRAPAATRRSQPAHDGSKFGLAPADAARACLDARARSAARLARPARAPRLAGGRPRRARGRRALVPRVLRRSMPSSRALIDVGGGLGIPYGHRSRRPTRARSPRRSPRRPRCGTSRSPSS